VLSTDVGAPHAIPVASVLRAGDCRILFCLRRDTQAMARVRESSQVALSLLGGHGTAFTARGHAQVLAESLPGQEDFAALELIVAAIDDHRRIGYSVTVLWGDEREFQAFRERISELQWLAA
jgi:hypothetical protein